MSFVHLHVHTDFSLLDGAASINSLVNKAVQCGMPGLAITDHGNMFGALRFYKACKSAGINPIVGSEFYLAGASRKEKTGTASGNKYYHLILLAKNEIGYKNLIVLSSLSYTEGFYYKPRIDWEILEQHHEGLICLSACILGEVPQHILLGKINEAENIAAKYRDLFGSENYFLELQNHGISEELRANRELVPLAKKLGIKLVATNDVHYLDKDDASAHDALLCIGTNQKISDQKRMRFSGDGFYLKSHEEMSSLFTDLPEVISNTLLINEMVKLDINLPGPLLPEFAIPSVYSAANDDEAAPYVVSVSNYLNAMSDADICKPNPKNGKIPIEELAPSIRAALKERLEAPITRYFIWASYNGLAKRYPNYTKEVSQRLDYELATIILMDFVGYYLIVADFINWAKDNDIPVGPGRGSGAASIVAYSLRITDIDPLKYKLLFERFLNPERVSMPDFDVDFCDEDRPRVIDYVTNKYGSDRVGQIITFGTLKAKAVIKDVARALDLPLDESTAITKLIPDDPKMTLDKAIELEPKLKQYTENPRYETMFRFAKKLENKNRHSSLHAAGIVIGKSQLTDYVPLFRDAKTGSIATQYTMDVLEECGLVKMDFLGLKTLTLIKNTIALIAKRGIVIIENEIPDDDKKTFEMLSEGKSTSVFQFESKGMQSVLRKARPSNIEDLIALNALYRPGPMDNIEQYVDSKHGRKTIVYPHPSLEKYLKETYGVIVYQEQVMQVAREVAGYSLGRADLLRRAMGKKKKDVLEKEEKPFIDGAISRGYSAEKAREIYNILVPFADYGFNKCHAAVYSVVAYRTAWLKANYPVEFMAANLTNEISNPDKLTLYINEARAMGITIIAPDINTSEARFTVYDGKIIYGLIGVKGVGDNVVEQIVAERNKNGKYQSFMDFLERVAVKCINKRVLEILINVGCFDSLGQSRSELKLNAERAAAYTQNKLEAGAYGQVSLFEDDIEEEFPPFVFEPASEMPRKELLSIERNLLGFYFSGHPIDEFKSLYEKYANIDFSNIEQSRKDKTYILIGQLVAWRETVTAKNKAMGYGKVESYYGSIDIVAFPDVFEANISKFIVDTIIFLEGNIDLSRGNTNFKIKTFLDPVKLKEKSYNNIHIGLKNTYTESELEDLKNILLDTSGPLGVIIHVPANPKPVLVKANYHIRANAGVVDLIRKAPIVSDVWLE